jgi:hypothetical protein
MGNEGRAIWARKKHEPLTVQVRHTPASPFLGIYAEILGKD